MPQGRKRAPGGGGRQSSNYQREVETYQKRLEVINFHDNNGMQATLDNWKWQTGFLRRHGLRIRTKTRQGQKKPADMEADAKEFWKNVAQVKEELGVKKVYNADQSGVCLEYLPKHTISEKGAKTVWV
ncbi:hypothetical protein F444_14272 [Phytophthora nicotianae P1976]|uniref:HTH CENPB-type domain-containing protein n=1 Tax=Phytophthora nicotianae P1976 TaxID=1317066 RepID=A0A080ZQY1_PHYNI|nr:hypothetical protein F444_14272 [Phytophthora nicotianae P1976]